MPNATSFNSHSLHWYAEACVEPALPARRQSGTELVPLLHAVPTDIRDADVRLELGGGTGAGAVRAIRTHLAVA